ncbi:MAG: FadR family transcriptional regulator [Deltaproteobacteria bacterium]|nr:FadR family transcriptional regulator [Deltaproteobacteria bacterium]MBW2384736.1 FadR family transcriptional regulator [Deltaproteobacteria bacterium]
MPGPPRNEIIAATLRDEILRGRFREGERLPSERDLADRFEAHRGTVREALKKLEQLGLAEIRPGGARVCPIQNASLDVVEHLLALEDPPDPHIVDEVLEVFSGLFAHAARLGVERADEAQRARARTLIDRMLDDALDAKARHETMHQLSDLFVEASGNSVLSLVRRGVKTHFLERLEDHEGLLTPEAPKRKPALRRLADALEARDGSEAADAILELAAFLRQHAVAVLEAARAEPRKLGASGAQSARGAH